MEELNVAPKLSIIVRHRNEFPTLLGTLLSLLEDAESSGLAFELIAVDNLSEDPSSDVLEDKFRRWVKTGLLKVVRYSEKPSTWCAINAGLAAADGDILVVADAHVSVRRGTLAKLAGGVVEYGGIWHPAVQLWGDADDAVGGYGYDLRLVERFWGNPCRYLPPGRKRGDFWRIPMAGACLLAVSRTEIERFGLYHPAFRAYGGGEPYLDLKWWLRGSAVWCHSGALVRHAFGMCAEWRTAGENDKPHKGEVYTAAGELTHTPKPGDRYLAYASGYKPPSNLDYAFNFSLAAWLLGGERWARNTAERLAPKIAEDVLTAVRAVGEPEFPAHDLDNLLASHPWERCVEHEQEARLP